MEDDHVDRPGVEERQRLKLTGTNSSIGLIVLIPNIHREIRWFDQRSRVVSAFGRTLREGAGKPATRSRACGLSPEGNLQKASPWHKDAIPGSRLNSFSNNVRFADLVVMAERLHPIPFRTRP